MIPALRIAKRGARSTYVETSRVVFVAAASALVAGVLVARSDRIAIALIVVVLLLLFAAYAAHRARYATIPLLLSLTLVPVYAVPDVGPLTPEPFAIAAIVFVGVVIATNQAGAIGKLTAIDLAFAATCGATILAALVGPPHVPSTLAGLLLWVPPYAAGRCMAARAEGERQFAVAVVVGACATVPFIAYETATQHNLFLSLAIPGTKETQLWARLAFRPGTHILRAEGPFGHPLSMSLIVSGSCLLAIVLAATARTRRTRLSWTVAAVALIGAQYTSGERTGWLMLVVGLLTLALTAVTKGTPLRYRVLLGIAAVGVAYLGFSAINDAGVTTDLSNSTTYRTALYAHAFQPGVLKPFGLPENIGGTGFDLFVSGIQIPGVPQGDVSIDSAYLQVADSYGIFAVLALLAVLVTVVVAVVRCRGSSLVALPVVALVNMLALFTIGFQTQVPMFVWLTVGAASGALARRRGLQATQGAPAESAVPAETDGSRP